MQTNDQLWKGIIEDLFVDFLYFFYPKDIHLFDLDKGFDFLDKELAKIFPESVNETRYIDKLVKIYLKDGTEKWILIHIEVQGYVDGKFAVRMFTYYYRIWDRFQKNITALAIFTDNNSSYEPNIYSASFLGTEIVYKFPSYKILNQDENELIRSENPFALVILASKMAIQSNKIGDEQLLQIKRNLIRLLHERQYPKEKIRCIFKFIQHYIRFEKQEFERIFAEEIAEIFYPNSKSMGIKEILEMQAIEKGRLEGIEIGKGLVEEERKKTTINGVLAAHKNGISIDLIANIFSISIDEVKDIIEKNRDK